MKRQKAVSGERTPCEKRLFCVCWDIVEKDMIGLLIIKINNDLINNMNANGEKMIVDKKL